MKCTTATTTAQSSCLNRINTKKQFNYGNVLGVNIMGNMVPVVYKVLLSSKGGKKGVVFYNNTRYHRCFLYEDNQLSACCRLVMKFNIDHYMKCYLPGTLGKNGAITTPYTFNHCKKCNATVTDSCGRMLAISKKRFWRNGNLVWKGCKVIRPCSKCTDGYPKDVQETVSNIVNNLSVSYNVVNTSAISCRCGRK